MNRGPKPEPPRSAYVEAVEELHRASPEQGVPVEAVAVRLDVPRRTAQHHLRNLWDAGKLERTMGRPSSGPPPWRYYPPEADD